MVMNTAQLQRSRGIARNATQATRRNMKPKQLVGAMQEKNETPRNEFNDEAWHEMVATAAYYRAQARGFDESSPEDDWYGAETELRARLARGEKDTEPGPDSGASLAETE
jgi:DUF2934 family protein